MALKHEGDSGNASMFEVSQLTESGLVPGGGRTVCSMCSKTPDSSTYSADYLSQLLKDKKQLAAFPNVFTQVSRLLDDEIQRVRMCLFQLDSESKSFILPEAVGQVVSEQEKVFIPVKDHPDYNFVGRILGPRGMTAKQLEQETGCKIMIRGKGSMRDKQKEEQNRGKPNWEHLSEELHVLVVCEDTENRCKVKLAKAVEEIKKMLVPATEGEDDLKRKQLMELAIINGTYRQSTGITGGARQPTPISLQGLPAAAAALQRNLGFPNHQRLLPTLPLAAAAAAAANNPLRSAATLGAPIILQPNPSAMGFPNPVAGANMFRDAGCTSTAAASTLLNMMQLSGADMSQFGRVNTVSPSASSLGKPDYSAMLLDQHNATGAILQRSLLSSQTRDHPYQRSM